MKDQLPLLLIFSPVIGFLVTLIAARAERDLVRQLAISNVFCSLLLFAGAIWQYQGERHDEWKTRELLTQEALASGAGKNVFEVVNSQIDRRRAERLGQTWFVIDGVNLWPMLLLIAISGIVCWQSEITASDQNWLFPMVLLFEATSLAALLSYDLRVFMIASGTSILAFGTMLGLWGGQARRELMVRFFIAQFCGGACVSLGFAMLVVAVPWMRIEDSPSIPSISWNIATMTYEIQKWTSGNPLAFQYQNEIFPWILLALSLGFAIQSGVFPFHSWLTEQLSRVPGAIALLFVSGLLSISGTGWLRFVMPLSPELLAAFDWLILVPALGSAAWGSVRALVPGMPRQRLAYLFLSLTGLSLLGCFSFSRVALSGMWLMQQQLIVTFCAAVIVLSSGRLFQRRRSGTLETSTFNLTDSRGNPLASLSDSNLQEQFTELRSADYVPSIRSLLMMTCLPAIGFFASGYMIFGELLRESLLLVLCMLLVSGLILLSVQSLLTFYASETVLKDLPAGSQLRIPGPAIIVLLLAVAVNIFPQQILASFEPDFIRVFQKYEQPSEPAGEPESDSRQ